MIIRRTLVKSAAAAIALSLAVSAAAQSAEPTRVVTTFSILGDMVKRLGGEYAAVTTLVGPDGDTHIYQPTPADARAVSEAELFIVNGLEFEGWLGRLAEAAAFDGALVVATAGIEPIAFESDHGEDHDDHDDHADGSHEQHQEELAKDKGDLDHDHGTFDPHAWQDLQYAVTYIDNITAALAQANPENAATFYQNRAAYVKEVKSLDAKIRAMMAALPEEKRSVVTSHDAFSYFAKRYGLSFEAPSGISTESEPSAADVAELIVQIRDEGISAVFVESVSDSRLLKQIARETGATIGGTLYSDALSGPDGPASTYLDMMRHNATMLAQALGELK